MPELELIPMSLGALGAEEQWRSALKEVVAAFADIDAGRRACGPAAVKLTIKLRQDNEGVIATARTNVTLPSLTSQGVFAHQSSDGSLMILRMPPQLELPGVTRIDTVARRKAMQTHRPDGAED